MKKIKFLVLLGFIMMCNSAFTQDPDFHIYLCFGQSNMNGAARAEAQDSSVDERFKVLYAVDCPGIGREKNKWYTATPPICECRAGISPVDYFGRTLVENLPKNIKIGVISVAVPGCKIELFDKNNYSSYVETAPDWMIGFINSYDGNPYGRLVELAKLAQKDGVIKGILLHQGESNPNDTLWTKKVKDIYDNLMADLSLNPEEVPLLAGETVNADQNGVCAGMNEIIATLPEKIPNSYVISSSGCPSKRDNLHFNAEGYRIFGRRYGEQMLKVLGY